MFVINNKSFVSYNRKDYVLDIFINCTENLNEIIVNLIVLTTKSKKKV